MPASVASPLLRVRDLSALRAAVSGFRHKGLRIGFVPTMGALHEGHLALVRHAKTLSDVVVVSVFVNPKQFAPHEDFDRYPRTEDKDAQLLESVGADLLYLPSVDLMYPAVFASSVHVEGPARELEGTFRPQFFDGVATVVMKLFNQVQPDVAVFGEKDYQQLQVVKTFVRDLDLPVNVVGMPTVREADGLALSSRNAYLSTDERQTAARLIVELNAVAEAVRSGGDREKALDAAKANLLAAGFGPVDYVELRDADTLAMADAQTPNLRLLAAAWLGKTRLIDNIAV
ncbi:pantoate--beta-alanine ligase [Asticcacaulis sp. DW145]|uniref:Pantothenate synthetase n=1 Tax=Asticcacaulis currens TaxID=2984210 RepID=A0ABT5II48_9CAUL|nr:pantoate--beta-alanine ligase [Asticcacaulis currens]MDC7695545.1 pantoate--beta-alanine ligase [Asticcacaulis currens]BEV10851.1 pantoate--beta-alanine ligase [Asticcacaulis sp. DW145]